jgi:hypothetical protein
MLRVSLLCSLSILAAALSGCVATQNAPSAALTGPPPQPSVSSSDVIGWGLGAYHREQDRAHGGHR